MLMVRSLAAPKNSRTSSFAIRSTHRPQKLPHLVFRYSIEVHAPLLSPSHVQVASRLTLAHRRTLQMFPPRRSKWKVSPWTEPQL